MWTLVRTIANNFTAACAIILSYSMLRGRTRFSVHFRWVKPEMGLQKGGCKPRIQSNAGGSDSGALSAFTPARNPPGWFIHINVSHCNGGGARGSLRSVRGKQNGREIATAILRRARPFSAITP